jgi:hypothetical protein
LIVGKGLSTERGTDHADPTLRSDRSAVGFFAFLEEEMAGKQLFVTSEKYPGEKARTLLPLTELVVWALEAPKIKPRP